MKRVSKIRLFGYTGLLIALMVAFYYKFEHRLHFPGGRRQVDSIPIETKETGQRVPGYDASAIHGAPPVSNWISAERVSARAALKGFQADLLIVPLQGGENTFDSIERSLISRLVADRVMHSTDLVVPNPTYVLRDLGRHLSAYTEEEIESLANYVGAHKILEIRGDHDRNGRFELVATLIDRDNGSVKRSKSWSNLKYEDSHPPFVATIDILGDLTEFVATETTPPRSSIQGLNLRDFRFPDSIDDLKRQSAISPLHSAAYLQLLGMLHPSGFYNETRYQLFERSLVQLEHVADSDSSRPYFRARALAYLDRRPAAIKALGDPRNPHEKALLAALNGDLPSLREHFERIESPALRFMALRDLLHVEEKYGDRKERPDMERLIEANPAWAAFIYRALRDTSQWSDYSAATIKLGLEQLAPAETVRLKSLIDKAAIVGDAPDELEFTRLVWRHIEAMNEQKIVGWASNPDNYLSVSELDVLDLGKTIAIANQIRRVDDDVSIRTLPESALKKIAAFDSLFSGHPAITLQKGRVLMALERDSDGAERKNLSEASATESLNGLAWTGQMTPDAAEAARTYNYLVNHSNSGHFSRRANAADFINGNPYRYFEWPMSQAWFQKIHPLEIDGNIIQSCIDYSWTAFHCLKGKIEHLESKPGYGESVRADLMSEHSHRYIGNPYRAEFEIASARVGGDEDSEIRMLRAQIENGSKNWAIYNALGRTLKRRGKHQAAQDVFLSYPGFLNTSRDVAVANSSYAGMAGSDFYWIGQYELALPLLEMAANSRTGSESSMSAGNRFSLIMGDLEAAEAWTASRVRRYGSKFALRDLQQILHVRGDSATAWSIFDEIQMSEQNAQMWSSALVGHRMESATTDDIMRWLQASDSRQKSTAWVRDPYRLIKLAPRYLLLAGTMDRVPGPELAKAISSFTYERPPTYRSRWKRDETGRSSPDERVGIVSEDGRSYAHDDLVPTPPNGHSVEPGQVIETRYEMLAKAMTAFLQEDYSNSLKLFNEAAYFYYLDEYLPYYAYSAAMEGSAAHIRVALEAREPTLAAKRRDEDLGSSDLGYRFDEDLTYAVLSAFEGHHESSISYLNSALNDRPYINERTVYPFYQVVDLADRLFEQTGVKGYRELALELSRRHTTVLPMYSWAYFVVAKYSESKAERVEAAASGLKLDPLSHRATQLSTDLIIRSEQHLQDHGAPFLRRSPETTNLGT